MAPRSAFPFVSGLRQDLDGASRAVYERLRGREIRARLELTVALGLLALPLGAFSNVLVFRERLPARLAGFGAMALVMLAAFLASRGRVGRRWARLLAVVHMALVIAGLIFLLAQSPAQLPVLVAPLSSVVMAAPLIFPWGAIEQAWLAAGAGTAFSALFLAVAPPASFEKGFDVILSCAVMILVSVVAAASLERHRRAAFAERRRVRLVARQRRRLLEIARDLRATLDQHVLARRLVEHARRLVPADLAILSIRDAATGELRVAATAGGERLAELVGLVLPADATEALCEAFRPREVHVSPGGPFDPLVGSGTATDGARRWLVARIGPPGAPLGFLGWGRLGEQAFGDLERRAAVEMADQATTALSAAQLYGKAVEASRLKSEFVSTISHEFRTPLSAIVGYAEMAQDAELSQEDHAAAIEGIESSARELLLLVEQTLDIARIEAGHSAVHMERIRLPVFWTAMHEMCKLLPRRPAVRLLWEADVPEVAFRCDRRRLGMILRNLVGNALKFTEAGWVRVSLALEGEDLAIAVEDTGIGIRPEDRLHIFEIFRQADGSETRRYEGTGLGLYIVSQFVRQLGGRVDVASEPGRGARFTVRLPSRRVSRPPAAGASGHGAAPLAAAPPGGTGR